jgi:protein phosphatase
MQIDGYAASETGPAREHNEDAWLVDVDGSLFVVADGMGGHAAGEVASRIAIETVSEVMLGAQDPEETRLLTHVEDPGDMLRERLRYAMNQAALNIRRAVDENPAYMGMGTTLVMVIVEDEQAHLAHVGDSRAYLVRDGRIQRLTRDHTVVQQEVDAGRLTPELARIVPHKNILTKSVGYHGPVDPDTSTRMLEAGDVIILCSDGLNDAVEDNEIETTANDTAPEDLPEVLVKKAIEQGSEDNVTVVVMAIS